MSEFWVVRLPGSELRWLKVTGTDKLAWTQHFTEREHFSTRSHAYEYLWRWRRHVEWCPNDWWGMFDVKSARVVKVTHRRKASHVESASVPDR